MMKHKPWLKKYDANVPGNINYPDVALFYYLEQAAIKFPNHTCSIFNGQVIQYRQMDCLVNSLATGLIKLGLKRGERVAIFLPNIPQFILAYYAVLKAGGVVVAINPTYKTEEISFILKDSGSVFLIGIDDAREMITPLLHRTGLCKIIFTSFDDSDKLPELTENHDGWFNPTCDEYNLLFILSYFFGALAPDIGVTSEDVAIFQYSGGTTGIPKAAVVLHRNLVANTLQFRNLQACLSEGEETFLLAIPLFHVYGMVEGLGVGICLGARLILVAEARDVGNILQNIQEYQATVFPGVPNLYHVINHYPGVQEGKYRLSSLKVCISGAAPLLRETKEVFEQISGAKLVEGYGLSEAPTATHCNPILSENRTGSIGLPLPDVDAKIISLEDGITELLPGEIGELVIKSPQLMRGYHNMPQETKLAIRDGWLFTGDVARMDEDGYFYLVDRKKDLIKVGGLQVWPREVEEVIAAHPAVLEVGVAGILHPEYGEMVKAWVVCKAGMFLAEDDITKWCKERIADYKAPRCVAFVEKLPRSTIGKLLRRELVRLNQ